MLAEQGVSWWLREPQSPVVPADVSGIRLAFVFGEAPPANLQTESTKAELERLAQMGVPVVMLTQAGNEAYGDVPIAVLSLPLEAQQVVGLLREWCGEGEVVPLDEALLQMFLDVSREDMQEIDSALRVGQYEHARYYAHRIRGAAIVIGCRRIAVAAAQFEWSARVGDVPQHCERSAAALRDALLQCAEGDIL
jgi:HPt (histidine-containing phosphotransfer) domain-containing protein